MLAALAAALPLWLVLPDGEERRAAAISDTTCEQRAYSEACAELNRLIADLEMQLGEIDRRQARVEELEVAIERNGLYLAGTRGDLPPDHALEVKSALEQSADFALASNLSKEFHQRLMAIIANLK